MKANPKRLTGRGVLIIALAAFGIIIAANLAMLFAATGSFPGLVVKNSYVASQGWDRRTAAQRALGWQASAAYRAGALHVTMTARDGKPVTGLTITAVVGRPASTREDIHLDLAEGSAGYVAPLDLAPGRWRVEISSTDAHDDHYEATAMLDVKEVD